jgi:hypothetical protein
MNLLLQIRVPPGTAHGPYLSGAPTFVVLAQPCRWLANKLELMETLATGEGLVQATVRLLLVLLRAQAQLA